MESFFSSLKTELIGRKVYCTRHAARADVFDYIERFGYQAIRRHSTIGYLSPVEFRAKVGLASTARPRNRQQAMVTSLVEGCERRLSASGPV